MDADADQSSERRVQAIAFLLEAYDGVSTAPGKGTPHAEAVADVLREAGYDEDVQIVGLLHDVIEDTERTIVDVSARFGDPVARTVAQLTEDAEIDDYRQRKRALRDQLAAAGSPALNIALADKIATLEHALRAGTPIRRRKLAHYRATLELGRAAGTAPSFCDRVELLLEQADAAFAHGLPTETAGG